MNYQGNPKSQGWWRQGGEVGNEWERVGDAHEYGKDKKRAKLIPKRANRCQLKGFW